MKLIFLFCYSPLVNFNLHILYKYHQRDWYVDNIYLGLFKALIFYILTFFYTKDKIQLTLIYSIIFILIMLFGGSRLILMCWMIFIFFAIKHNRGFNLGILVSSIYFFIKSLDYFHIIYYCGASSWAMSHCNRFLTTGSIW